MSATVSPSPVTLCALGVYIHVGVPSGIPAGLPLCLLSHFLHAGLGVRWEWEDPELSEEEEGTPRGCPGPASAWSRRASGGGNATLQLAQEYLQRASL